MSNYYTTTLIDQEEFSEIDFELYNEIFGEDASNDDDWDPREIVVGNHNIDAYPIDINLVIKQLERFKEKGANYVVMEYHCDHIGYPMAGVHIRKSTEQEIEVQENKKLTDKKKRERMQELRNELHKLQNEE